MCLRNLGFKESSMSFGFVCINNEDLDACCWSQICNMKGLKMEIWRILTGVILTGHVH